MHHRKNKGFTLVELLIAISLIAILVGVLFSVINPRGIQARARDSQRFSDLSKIKVALENYFSDTRAYPNSDGSWMLIGESGLLGALTTDYMNVLPTDPKPSASDCVTANWRNYFYKSSAGGKQYVLATNPETGTGNSCPISALCSGLSACNGTAVYYVTAD